MYTVYILISQKSKRYYIGYTSDLRKRLLAHNSGNVRSTKAYRPWEVVYTEKILSKENAYKREREIKSYKGGNAFKKLIEGGIPKRS